MRFSAIVKANLSLVSSTVWGGLVAVVIALMWGKSLESWCVDELINAWDWCDISLDRLVLEMLWVGMSLINSRRSVKSLGSAMGGLTRWLGLETSVE